MLLKMQKFLYIHNELFKKNMFEYESDTKEKNKR